MSASKIPVAPTNLRERIAALEQRNAALDQRPTSPAPLSAAPTSPSAGGLREKIAKFERKGGTPVPRGSFGLGAPPPTVGQPRRKGELYGNRIPVPTRMASSGAPPVSRSGTPRLAGSPSPHRRSFSLSSVSGDFDDGRTDYTPMTSPTFTTPPDSPPDSVSFTPPFTPEISPSPTTSLMDLNAFKKPLLRGTDFARALEIARKTESRRVDNVSDVFGIRQEEEGLDTPTPQVSSLPSSVGEAETDSPEPTPAIVVSSEDAPLIVVQQSPALDAHSFIVLQETEVVEDAAQELVVEPIAQVLEAKSAFSQPDTEVEVESVAVDDSVIVATEPKFPPAEIETVEPAHPIVITVPPVDTPLQPSDRASDVVIVSTESPSSLTHAVERPITPVAVAVAPEVSVTKEHHTTMEQVPPPIDVPSPESFSRNSAASITIVVESPSSAPPPFTPDSEPSPTLSEKTLFAPASLEFEDVVPATSLELSESLFVSDDTELQDVPSTPVVVISEPPPVVEESTTTEDILLPSLSPTVVLTNTGPEETQVEVSAPTTPIELPSDLPLPKKALTLDVDRLNDDSLVSPTSQGSVIASSALEGNLSVSDVLGGYFGSGKSAPNGQVEEKDAEPVVQQPLQSPLAAEPKEQEQPSSPSSSFLSPPGTGIFSPAPTATSFASLSSLDTSSISSSRPFSMIETSPSRVTLAHRLTPATSRGVPMFVPPTSSLPHKSDFSHFPPTPEAEREDFGFGSVTVHHKPSHSYSHPNTHVALGAAAEEQSDAARPTFTAVVHGKVREGSASASRTRVVPQTPKTNRVNRATILQTPLSPGTGELAALLQNAIFLEDTLERGEDPREAAKRLAEEEKQEKLKKEQEAAAAKAKAEQEEKERAALAQAEAEARKEGSSSAKLKHTFLIPLSRARTAHRKEVTTSVVEGSTSIRQSYPELVRPKSANTESPSRRLEVNTDSLPRRPPTPVESKDKTTELPAKSPRSRFASFRRLGSISRSSKDGSRHSTSMSSEMSSEDSAPALTPPDHTSEYSVLSTSVSEFGQNGNGSGMSWPSLSPKKSTGSISRAASFAEKIWSRARTKSGGSTFSTKSSMFSAGADLTPERVKDRAEKVSSIGPPPSFSLPPLPTVAEPEEIRSITPPTQSASLKPRALPTIPKSATLPATPYSPYTHKQPSPKIDYLSPRDSLLPVLEDRPESWMSASSLNSVLPSPLFDKDLWDAFPAVPGGAPMATSGGAYAPGAGPSFDSALLSSAIHLASTHKGTSTYNAMGSQPR